MNEVLIKFTAKPPPCPKCGSKEVKRHHRESNAEMFPSKFRWLDELEFLKLTCQSCHYQWGQEVNNV
ncbi:hypothetical protein LCGC14_3077620 [marine sediment metagenome]|uniref:Uncharacterized protein n=1 Tax=marine sediment metagenome TaxID=412755 RepID=A0A0F8Z4X5_9ZZZZ